MVDITVVIATHNGAHVLQRTLQGYVDVAASDANWKIVLVDNASTDATAQIIQSFTGQLPLTALYVGQPGKNEALNAAISELEGEIVVLSDDDAIPQSGFLDAWRAAFKRMPEYDLFGGEIDLLFEEPPPDWFLREQPRFEELYSLRKGVAEGPIQPDQIFGPNMAVRRRLFDENMRFDTRIGPNSTDPNYGMGSETEFCVRSVRQGYRSGFANGPQVLHIVRPHQIRQDFWDGRAYRLGRGLASKQIATGELKLRRRSRPVRLAGGVWKRVQRLRLRGLAALPADEATRFGRRWEYNLACGFHDEMLRVKKLSTPPPGQVTAPSSL